MKNAIKYYYDLEVENIVEKCSNYKLIIDSKNYLLCKCDKNELLSILKYINNYDFHTIMSTKDGNITILLNNIEYVLLKLNKPYKEISIDDIYEFKYPLNIPFDSNRWISLWSNHIDYIEYQIHELANKYPILARYTYYYIGLTETAIELLKTVNINANEYIMHKRISKNMTLVDLYNPINLVLDTKSRDIAEYYKDKFFNGDNNILSDVFNNIKDYNEGELILFFIRMLYPTYFFDLYDKIIGYNVDEKVIYEIVNKSYEYEELLKELYLGIKKATHIENIEWLNQLH